MTDPAHSDIGPSALHRLLSCPGSYQLTRALIRTSGSGSSVWAAQGSVAHQIVEAELREEGLMSSAPVLDEVVPYDGHDILVDQEMLDGAQKMIDFCERLKVGANKVWVEEKLDLGFLWDGNPPSPIFGTVDFGAFVPQTDTLHVADFKYGLIAVDPYDNEHA